MVPAVDQLWPAPISCRTSEGTLSLAGDVTLELGNGAEAWDSLLLHRLAWLQPRTGTSAATAVTAVTLHVDLDPSLLAEEFVLDVDASGITLRAGSELGAGHATVTLRQLLTADAFRAAALHRHDWVLPFVHIHDAPAFAWRGFLLDVVRHFTPKDELLRVIDRMAMHRLNRLHLHLTDDQGWRFESPTYPELASIASSRESSGIGMISFDGTPQELDGTPHGGIYTVDDLREITAYAKLNGIVVVPELDLPAHAGALLAAVPAARVPGAPVPAVQTNFAPSGRVVNPLPAGREVLATLIGELAAAVDSPYLHIGGDEASLADWESSSEVQTYIAERGLADVQALRVDLSAFLVSVVESLGRTPVVWEEAFIGGGISQQTVVMAWRAEQAGLAAMEQGHDVVMLPIAGNYLDYAEDSPDEPLALGSGQGIDRIAAYSPSRGAGPGRLLGVQAALWTEFAPDARLRAYKMFPRLSMHAANAWTGAATPWPEARPRFGHHLERLAAAGIEFRPLDGPHPWQRGGTGRRQNTSPLTMDMILTMTAAMAQGTDAPDLEELARLLHDSGTQ